MAKIDDSVKKKVPELRFPGFTDDWEERKLTDVTYSYSGLTYSPTDVQDKGTFVLRSSNVKNDQLIDADNVYVNPDIVNSNNVKVGDVIVVVRNGSRSLIGKHAIVTKEMPHTVIGAFMSAFRGENGDYINALLSTNNFQKEVHKSLGATINQITGKDFSMMNFLTPKLEEQNKIGSFFKQLDNTITLHQRKLDLLKEQKKGYLQKMFPKNGAKVPELRFAGFADDWEERKLGEVIDIENGYAFKSEYFSDEEKRHIVLTPGSVKIGGGFQKDKGRYYDVSGVFPEKFIFKPGNIFITMTDLTPTAQSLGYPAIVPRDDNVYLHNQRLGKIINTTTNPEFLYTLLTTDTYHKEIVSSASGTTVKHSSISKILDFKSAIPNIDEQKLIGSFFKELDNTIALHQRKLDLLKEQKKGFLQKMFV
ncbi:Type I restriction-modification system, specificity subunit S [Enterococcus durans]|uniref:restriction endonuclease subunit S n=1 Tax=Enterococcus durans TaxID=53345 RepID=UPI000E01720A|nr:Type I restriction-modification system, specificity subunit S [Enterococcus durans]